MRRRTKNRLAAGIGLGLALAVAIAAVLVPGYSSIQPDLDSGSVWVANGRSNQIGAANASIDGLQDILRVPPGDVRMEQSDAGVLLIDDTNGTLRAVVPSNATLGPTVPIPPGADVQLRQDRVLLTDPATGDVFSATFESIAAGEPIESPVVQLGRGGVAVLGETQILAASAGLGRVITVDPGTGETVKSEPVSMSAGAPKLQVTALGDRWVLYDSTSHTISSGGWSKPLDHSLVTLQEPGEASNQVLFATQNGLVSATIGLGAEDVLMAGVEGTPTAPLLHEGCVYGVWSSGAAWRDCGEGELLQLFRPSGDADVRISARGASVVASEPSNGNTWALSGSGDLISDWLEPSDVDPEQDDGQQETPIEQEIEETAQEPPVAEDDELGARAGQVTVLSVLRNDSDPNNDPLMITEVTGHSGATITDSGQEIRLELADNARSAELQYTVSDGHGGEDSATVTVDVRRSGNEPPQQQRQTTVTMGAGGSTSIDALADWVDPEGDPLTLESVEASGPDSATTRPDGRLEIRDGGAGGVRQYTITVSDGVSTEEGVVIVTTTEQPPIHAEPVTATAAVGSTIEIDPMLSASGGEGELRLHNVQLPESVGGEVRYDKGTLTLTPDTEGDYVFPYVVTDGTSTKQGQIRLQATEPLTASSPPLPIPHAVTMLPLGNAEIDVSEIVSDPAGGALMVTDVSTDAQNVSVSLRDLQRIGIDITGPLDERATISYTVSNGTASATGVVSVSESASSGAQAPIAREDEVRVSPGSAVAVPVLSNDEHPDLEAVSLEPELLEGPQDGIMFVSGNQIKFLAPEEEGVYSGVYEITAPDGQRDRARVTVTVGAQGSGTNQPPNAPNLDAKVLAGSSVEISVPLAGSDPNGDSVQLLGQSSTPSLGTLSRIDADTFRYTAGPYSTGTDVITYLVADEGGAQSEGTLTVAVAQPADVPLGPNAYADHVEMRPDTLLAVDVLANDVDAAGLPLRLKSVEVLRGDAEAEVREGALVVTAGADEGEVGLVYTVENERGATSVAWVTVDVDENAEPPPPVADDVEVSLASILDRESVSVQPLDVVSVADGRSDLLVASVVAGGEEVTQRGDGAFDIPLSETRQELAYKIVRTDTGAETFGIIHVPGTRDSLPQLRDGTNPITVPSGQTLSIDINDHIIAATGRPVWITDASLVQATNSNDAPLVRDSQTIEFTSAPGYFGPANVSLEVTDGDSPSDPDGRVGFIVLPIEVVADASIPAAVQNTTLQMEPGSTRDISLSLITTNPAAAALNYSVLEGAGGDFTLSFVGDTLRVQASPRAEVGAVSSARIGVRSPDVDGVPGTLSLQVVSSTRPLVSTARDSVDLQRGTTENVQPLLNDEATNPFSDPLMIDQVESASSDVTATLAADGRTVTVQADADADIETVSVRYRVLDATRDSARAVWGVISVRLQDVPEAPAAPVQRTDDHIDGVLLIDVETPDENNSPLTGYTLTDQNGAEYDCPASGQCQVEGLPSGVDYRFTAVAHNELGSSEPSQQSDVMRSDSLPNAVAGVTSRPTGTPGTMQVSWRAATVPEGGSPVDGYIVQVQGPGANITQRVDGSTLSATIRGLSAGETYSVTVAATNGAQVADDVWQRTSPPHSMTAVGRPSETTVVLRDYNQAESTVGATWDAASAGGASQVRYRIQVIAASEQSSFACTSAGGGNPQGQQARSVDGLQIERGSRSVVAVIADNGWFCQTSFSPIVQGAPDPLPSTPAVVLVEAGDSVDPNVGETPTLRPGHTLEARVRQGADTLQGWRAAAEGDRLTSPMTGRLEYSQPVSIDFRQCVRDASFGKQCSDPTSAVLRTPFSLKVDTVCRPGSPLDHSAQLPPGASARYETELRVDGAWADHPDYSAVPDGATDGRTTLTVKHQGKTYESSQQGFTCQN